jgi:hypothetical protein
MHLGLPVVLRSGTAAAEVLGCESYEFATTHECCIRINQIMGQDQFQGLGRHLHEQSQALVKFAQAKRFVDLLKNP